MNNPKVIFASAIVALSTAACASNKPSQALVDARAAYAEAEQGPALQYEPDKLDGAKQALDQAELAYRDDAGSEREQHLAYLAQRQAEIAAAYGEKTAATKEAAQAEQDYVASLENAHELTKEELAAQKQQAALEEQQEIKDQLNMTEEELAQARAEKAAAEAELEELKKVASVKKDEKETIITIPGEVLFQSGKAVLMPEAQRKLEAVAKVLQREQESKDLMVVGHTDSQGADNYNKQLSLDRAEAVRMFLVTHGVSAEKVQAEGMGEAEPVANNDTPEGRANNRRVEIVMTNRTS